MTIIWLLKRNKLDILINHFIPTSPKINVSVLIGCNWLLITFLLGWPRLAPRLAVDIGPNSDLDAMGVLRKENELYWHWMTIGIDFVTICPDPDWRSKCFIGIYLVLAIPTRFHWSLLIVAWCLFSLAYNLPW